MRFTLRRWLLAAACYSWARNGCAGIRLGPFAVWLSDANRPPSKWRCQPWVGFSIISGRASKANFTGSDIFTMKLWWIEPTLYLPPFLPTDTTLSWRWF